MEIVAQIEGITEKNRVSKFAYFAKSLADALYVDADFCENYQKFAKILEKSIKNAQKPLKIPNFLEISVKNADEKNAREKFAKAVNAAAKALKIPAEAEEGERFLLPIQRELFEKWTETWREMSRKVYFLVCDALALPKMSAEVLKKSQGGEPLKWRGKVFYDPETGLPFKKSDFDRLVSAIEKFLQKNAAALGGKMALNAAALQKILSRLAKSSTTDEMQKLKLADLRWKGKGFDAVSDGVRAMAAAFGLSEGEARRYQAAADWTAHLVTRMCDDEKNAVKEEVLAGIRERRTKAQVSQNLFNRMAGLNRDWRRIANTEIVNAANLAECLEAAEKAGEGGKVYLRRYELAGCCPVCEAANGKIALWSPVPLETDRIRDDIAEEAIWEGKDRAERKGQLLTGALHPNCRGGWTAYDGRFDAIDAAILKKESKWNSAVREARKAYGGAVSRGRMTREEFEEKTQKIYSHS